MTDLQALNNYCTLEIIEPQEIEKGMILLPSVTNTTPRWAKVLSVGPGVTDGYGTLRKPDVEVGEIVYTMAHGQYSIHKTKDGPDNLAATSTLDILAILKDLDTLSIQPLGSYIEIEKVELPDTNEFGIELPDSKKVPTNIGIVRAVGKGWTGPYGNLIPMQVEEGQAVVFSPLRLMVIDFTSLGRDEKKYLVNHGDIIGTIKL